MCVIAAMCLSSVSFAQETRPATSVPASDEQNFHFGFKFAPTLAWIKADSKGLERDGSKIGFSYGITTEFKIQENYAFATGMQATYRGGRVNFRYGNDATYPEVSYRLNMQYVEIPLTLKMKTNEFNKVRYFGQFGFAPGYCIRAKGETEIVNQGSRQFIQDTEYEDDYKDYVNSFNLSMIIAAGAEYRLAGSTVVFSSLEFNNGFIDVFGKVKQPFVSPTPQEVKWTGFSNYFALNVGILF
jgi:hypothetical protein